ncbi:rho GDP-dissociation inhibitor 1-like [Aristolochia californica]|uniref:rho GDP-dissociation inhibitor 1-like n=1 Tax=Aristolochia californica TaxID=171875 RepID=UPI0035DEC9E4
MSMTIGAVSSSKTMGFDARKQSPKEENGVPYGTASEGLGDDPDKYDGQMSEVSCDATEEEEEGEEGKNSKNFVLGPQFTLKEQLEKDKEDESLRRWKEQLLGTVDLESIGETLEPEVKILGISILSPGRPELPLPIPEASNFKGLWFTLKEGSHYKLKLTFRVSNNIVSGLKYSNSVWKTGVKVDSRKEMLGTFSPQSEPYVHELPEDITPSGLFARGSYSARTKFLDDDNKCYLEVNYTFDIRKEWARSS